MASTTQSSIRSTTDWLHASRSFNRLQHLITWPYQRSLSSKYLSTTQKIHTRDPESTASSSQAERAEREYREEVANHLEKVRQGSLPWVVVLKAGTFQLQITAVREPLECLVLGTVAYKRWVEVLWEAVRVWKDEVKIHYIKVLFGHEVLISGWGCEFLVQYFEAEELVRRFPTTSGILNAPKSFLKDPSIHLDDKVRRAVFRLQRNETQFDEDQKFAYYYTRALCIAMGIFNAEGALQGFNFEDFDRTCGQPEQGDYTTGVGNILLRFFQRLRIKLDIPDSPTLKDWDRVLRTAQNKPFHMSMQNFTFFVEISMVYGGPSKLKGGEWLSSIDGRVVGLKECIEVGKPDATVRVWPQRLVRSEAEPSDDVYEGSIMMGVKCPETKLQWVKDMCEQWKEAVNEDPLVPDACFIFVTVHEQGSSAIKNSDLKPDTRLWPRSIVKEEDKYLKLRDDSDGKDRRKKGSGHKPPGQVNTWNQMAEHGYNQNDTKSVKLRPAAEVLSRLCHDRKYNIDDCIVGYKDRHLNKTQEKPAVDWILETTHEEFIPQHRIEYFRKGGEIIWHRQAKIDKVFNSGV
ncbi:Leukocyte receptor cluster member 9 [Hyphodiscus hymeniophilus]|uniref:Leukocyte receptor cluster member 9 n=1 Tax=Hyphodiscus hymeniophilus TaxID=353542 RepID=A0A9P6VFA9_9HELO|nr:Leukocyte receptor cluster member 9 [Hyphodiscus hymeniophilus]